MRAALVLALVAATGVAHADGSELHGTVIDRETREPVAGATVTVGGELTASDDNGAFTVTLAPGSYVLEVTADWLEPVKRSISIGSGTPDDIVIEVEPRVSPSGETIDVVGVAPTAPGETKVEAKFARTLPGGGDAAKIVQSLPAVARPAAGST